MKLDWGEIEAKLQQQDHRIKQASQSCMWNVLYHRILWSLLPSYVLRYCNNAPPPNSKYDLHLLSLDNIGLSFYFKGSVKLCSQRAANVVVVRRKGPL